MTSTVIQGGRVVDQTGIRRCDVRVDDESGLITEVGEGLTGDTTLDAQRCWVAPGFVDIHAHVREPGNEQWGTIESESRAAALGGYTAIVAMPDTDPPADNASVVKEILALSRDALCEVSPAGAITVGRQGTALAPLGEMADLGVRIFTDSGHSLQDALVMRRAMEYANGISTDDGARVVIAQHPQLDALAVDGVMHEGGWSARLGLEGQLAEAEEIMIMREVALARLTGARVHIHHVTTANSVNLIRGAKANGVLITADVTPHHLLLTDAACQSYDANTKVAPPMRTDVDIQALRAGLADGTIDAIATDHAPVGVDAKELPFDQAPFGVVGLETALPVLLTSLGKPFEALLPALSWRPADIAGLRSRHGGPIEPGRCANLVVVDPSAEWTIDRTTLSGPSTNTPFDGVTVRGRIRHTIYEGQPVVIDAKAMR